MQNTSSPFEPMAYPPQVLVLALVLVLVRALVLVLDNS